MSTTQRDLNKLQALARVLIPGTDKMPAVDQIAGFDALLARAVKATALTDTELGAVLDALPASLDWDAAKALAKAQPALFETASTLASGAYLLAPEVLAALRFPTERRFPAGPMDFADEYETGIVDPVIAHGQRWVDPRKR
jgi:Arc/MetJ family transcription regulator